MTRTALGVLIGSMVLTTACSTTTSSTSTSMGTSAGVRTSGAGADSESALGVVDATVGTGARAGRGQCLYVHYTGVLRDGRQFETSRDTTTARGRSAAPIVFELGTRMVMPGWEQGLPGMRVGGTRRLYVPFRLAYGANGRPPAIPPRTDLVFDIQLLAVAPALPTSSNAMRDESAKSCPPWESVNRSR